MGRATERHFAGLSAALFGLLGPLTLFARRASPRPGEWPKGHSAPGHRTISLNGIPIRPELFCSNNGLLQSHRNVIAHSVLRFPRAIAIGIQEVPFQTLIENVCSLVALSWTAYFSVYDLRPFRTCKMLDSQGASFERHRNTLVPNQPPPKSRKRLSLMTEPASNCWTQFSKVEPPPDSRGELYLFHQGRDMPDAGTTFARMDTPAGPGEDLSSKGGPFRTRAGQTFLFNGGPSRRQA